MKSKVCCGDRGISNCLRCLLCDHHEEEGDGDGDAGNGDVAALSDPVSAYGRQIVCAICAPAPRRLFMMLLNFALKRSRKNYNRRRHRVKLTRWRRADRKRWPSGKCERCEVREMSIVKINYCGFLRVRKVSRATD